MRGGGVTLFVSSVLFVVAFASSALAFAPVRVPLASRPEQVLARSSTSSLESPVEKRMDLRNVIQHQEKESDKIPPPLSEMPPLGYGISRWPRMSQIDVKQVSRDVSEWATMAIAVPAVVILWAGAWMLLDSVVPGGTMWPKELFFALAGGIWMVNSNVMFCSAYMDSLRGRTMWDDRPTGPPRLTLSYAETLGNKVAYYLEEAGSFMAPVVFWSGVYNLQDRYLPDNQVINALCVVSGCAVLVWVVIAEDARKRADTQFPKLSNRPIDQKLVLYSMAAACNIFQVVLWRGVEYTSTNLVPDSMDDWGGVILGVGGGFLLQLTSLLSSVVQRLVEMRYGAQTTAVAVTAMSTAMELIALVLIWTGIEWYIWDSTYIQETFLRDIMYLTGGWMVLSLTGKVDMIAGRAAPMGVYEDVHTDHLNMEEVENPTVFDLSDDGDGVNELEAGMSVPSALSGHACSSALSGDGTSILSSDESVEQVPILVDAFHSEHTSKYGSV